jgi:YidC/Oxa1 family membrane protein insertase
LQAKYGNNRERLGQEIAKLQRESGTSLFAGCLPMLLQIPFFIVMFRLFSTGTVAGHPNELLARELFGAPLGLRWSAAPADPVFLVLFAALAVVAWCSARLMRQTAAEAPALLRLLPYGSIVAATVLPLAAGVYLVTTTAWATAERAYLRR